MAARTSDAPETLSALLDKLLEAAKQNGSKLSAGELVETIGRRSFGPLLLLGGLLGMTPVSAIPTAPTIIALIVLLIAGQLLFGMKSVWLPRWLSNRSVKATKVEKAVAVARKPAGAVDKVIRPRLLVLTGPVGDRVAALVCVIIALAVPPLEFLPFVAFIPSLAIATFGLALIARDGLLVAIAFLISAAALGFGAWKLFG